MRCTFKGLVSPFSKKHPSKMKMKIPEERKKTKGESKEGDTWDKDNKSPLLGPYTHQEERGCAERMQQTIKAEQ